MSSLFYNLGRGLGRATLPAVQKVRWGWNSLLGSEDDRIRAEKGFGRTLAMEFRAKAEGHADPADAALVSGLCQQLAARVKNKLLSFSAEVVRLPEPTALALPGGFVFVSLPLLDLCQRYPDELAFVLGHEMAHVIRGHAADRMLHDSALNLAARVAGRAGPLGTWLRGTGLQMLASAYSQDCEFEADELGSRLADAAGYPPLASVRLFQRLQALHQNQTPLGQYFSSHPTPAERIAQMGRLWQRRASSLRRP